MIDTIACPKYGWLVRSVTFHIITPFTRYIHLRHLLPMLRTAGVQWYPVLDNDLPKIDFAECWIHPIYAPPPPPKWFVGHFLFNYALDFLTKGSGGFTMQDEDYYSIITDDDFYEPGFFEKLRKYEGEILITSMKRGDRSIGRHPKSTLLARPDFMRRGLVALEQMFMIGRLARSLRLQSSFDSDGLLVEQVVANHKVTYVPDAFVWFNYLEPGRWENSPFPKAESFWEASSRVITRFLYEQKLKLPKAIAGRRILQREVEIRR